MKQLGALIAACLLIACQSRSPGASGKRALLIGGSGPEGESVFFVQDLEELRSGLLARGWKVDAVIGKQPGLLKGSVPASNTNIRQRVHETLASARSGQPVLLVFHAHGFERESDWGQKSHSIQTEDKSSVGLEPGFDLDTLEPELLSAQKRGVRVALVDLSCYSGWTQKLRGAACTVSLAAPSYVSFCSGRESERHFSHHFLKLPPPGQHKDLESQFLQAREKDLLSINLPQISSRETPALAGWDSFLLEVDPLDVFEDLRKLRPGNTLYDLKRLTQVIDQELRKPTLESAAPELRSRIETAAREVLELRRELEKRVPELSKQYDTRNLDIEVSGRDPIRLAPAILSEALEEKAKPDLTHAQQTLIAILKPISSELDKKFKEPLEAFRNKREEFDRIQDMLEEAASGLLSVEREFYRLVSKEKNEASNECRKFEL